MANATANVLIQWRMKDLELSLAQPVATLKSILLNGRVMAGIVLFALNRSVTNKWLTVFR